MLSSEIMAIFTIRMLLDEKEFKKNVEEIDDIKDMEEGISLILQ
jgi:hypothetical protein